jgi:hypothetical protein
MRVGGGYVCLSADFISESTERIVMKLVGYRGQRRCYAYAVELPRDQKMEITIYEQEMVM